MSRVTVIPSDNIILVDGLGLNFDFNAPADMHALQWQGDSGWIEFNDGRRNREIVSYDTDVAPFMVLWEAEKARLDELTRKLEAELNRLPTLEEARAAKLAEILAGANAMDAASKARYSRPEIGSWQRQEAEASALLSSVRASTMPVDENAPTPQTAAAIAPLVCDLAANAGVSPLEFSRRIVGNAAAATVAAKDIILQQQAMEKAAKEATSVEAVRAITVNYILRA